MMDSPIDTPLQLAEKKERIDIAIALVVVLLAGIMLWTYGLGHLGAANANADASSSSLVSNKMGVERLTVDNRAYVPLTAVPVAKPMVAKPASIVSRRVTSVAGSSMAQSVAVVTTVEPMPDQPVAEASLAADTISAAAIHTAQLDTTTTLEIPKNAPVLQETTPVVEKAAPVETTASTPVVDKSCAIIVGAYGSSKNALKMKSRLADAGYTVFETPYRTLTRVGVYSPCRIDELSTALKKIRRDFASDATVLEAE